MSPGSAGFCGKRRNFPGSAGILAGSAYRNARDFRKYKILPGNAGLCGKRRILPGSAGILAGSAYQHYWNEVPKMAKLLKILRAEFSRAESSKLSTSKSPQERNHERVVCTRLCATF
jgi:hypothetical protein